MSTIIKKGTIATENVVYQADVLIEKGKIAAIGNEINSDQAKIIDATGKYVIPGAVDAHTHLDLDAGIARAVDDFYSGTVAAACGGTTTIIDHLAFGPKGCNLHHQIEEYHRLADGNAVVDYGFHGVVQQVNESILREMEELVEAGIPSFKIYLTYDYKLNDAEVMRVLAKMKELGGVTAAHAENNDVINYLRKTFVEKGKTEPIYHALSRPSECEAEAVERMLHLARLVGDAPLYIVHLSTAEGLQAVEKARENGQQNIYVETCPQYLTLTEEKYLGANGAGLKYIMSPPLRKKKDCEMLWQGVAEQQIEVIATDHCPFHFRKEKQLGKDDFTQCPNGAPGIEERVRVIFSEGVMKKRISLEQFVAVMCTNPAKIYGLYPRKGTILPGSDADIVIINPQKREILTKERIKGAVDYTVYEGLEVQGVIDLVMQRGKIIVEDHTFLGQRGDGLFLQRKAER
ncbi:MAG: dihydropyrimidinase [Peptococcia bacterium]|jgi:dihydropyrimidinase